MAEIQMLGLFTETTQVADAVEALRGQGIRDNQITILSGVPYKPEMLSRPHQAGVLPKISLLGALLGVAGAAFLTVGIFLLYPIVQGGQPIVPIPPSLIVFFEVIMLGTMWATFFGMIWLNRFPVFKRQLYDTRITEGYIGIVVAFDSSLESQFGDLLKSKGAVDIKHEEAEVHVDRGFRKFWLRVAGALVVATVILGLFLYDVLRIPFPTNMANQDSFGFEQGPRLAAPTDAVPIQGPVLINNVPASSPLPADARSLQDGQVQYGINCAMCHGATGVGNGLVGAFFTTKPFDLTSQQVQGLTDQEIFLVITNGKDPMPPIAENLTVTQRWDLVNYIRSLKK